MNVDNTFPNGIKFEGSDGRIWVTCGSARTTASDPATAFGKALDASKLRVDLPPWNDDHSSRIWPNVIPLPEGYPAPYIALMMDRVNFPGMPKPNWTYGALYLYHGYPTKP